MKINLKKKLKNLLNNFFLLLKDINITSVVRVKLRII
jgi:hypothetical protein